MGECNKREKETKREKKKNRRQVEGEEEGRKGNLLIPGTPKDLQPKLKAAWE